MSCVTADANNLLILIGVRENEGADVGCNETWKPI